MLKYTIASKLGWIFREQSSQDKGVDAQVEEVLDGHATGRLLGVQVKSGLSWLKQRNGSGYVYHGDLAHLTYWQGHRLPILIVLVDPNEGEAYWQLVTDDRVRLTPKGWAIVVPFSQKISAETAGYWHEICLPAATKRPFPTPCCRDSQVMWWA